MFFWVNKKCGVASAAHSLNYYSLNLIHYNTRFYYSVISLIPNRDTV
jgi:hypothetical protein